MSWMLMPLDYGIKDRIKLESCPAPISGFDIRCHYCQNTIMTNVPGSAHGSVFNQPAQDHWDNDCAANPAYIQPPMPIQANATGVNKYSPAPKPAYVVGSHEFDPVGPNYRCRHCGYTGLLGYLKSPTHPLPLCTKPFVPFNTPSPTPPMSPSAVLRKNPFVTVTGQIGGVVYKRAREDEVKKCECGIDAIGGGIHSNWCPKHGNH